MIKGLLVARHQGALWVHFEAFWSKFEAISKHGREWEADRLGLPVNQFLGGFSVLFWLENGAIQIDISRA